jgi:hypothetical protein
MIEESVLLAKTHCSEGKRQSNTKHFWIVGGKDGVAFPVRCFLFQKASLLGRQTPQSGF